jgi:probable rRNA maturation factor
LSAVPVEFRCGTPRGRAHVSKLIVDAKRLLAAARLPDCELSLTLTSDRAIRALNRKYRGKDAPTDVLSFSQIEEAGRPALDPLRIENVQDQALGDVVISIDTALRQARELGVSPAMRLRTLLAHGFLHLLGYDHERSAADARRMFARQRRLEARLADNAADERAVRRPTIRSK